MNRRYLPVFSLLLCRYFNEKTVPLVFSFSSIITDDYLNWDVFLFCARASRAVNLECLFLLVGWMQDVCSDVCSEVQRSDELQKKFLYRFWNRRTRSPFLFWRTPRWNERGMVELHSVVAISAFIWFCGGGITHWLYICRTLTIVIYIRPFQHSNFWHDQQ